MNETLTVQGPSGRTAGFAGGTEAADEQRHNQRPKHKKRNASHEDIEKNRGEEVKVVGCMQASAPAAASNLHGFRNVGECVDFDNVFAHNESIAVLHRVFHTFNVSELDECVA